MSHDLTPPELPGGQHPGCRETPGEETSLQGEGGTDRGQEGGGDGSVQEGESPSVVSQWVGGIPF